MNANAKTIATYAAAGMNDKEIAAKMGMCVRQIFEIRRYNNITSPVTLESERKRRSIAHLHECGLTDEEIALTSGMAWQSVRYIRRKMGLEANKPLVPRGLPPRIQAERKAESARRYQAKKLAAQGKTPRPKPKPKPVNPAPKPVAVAPKPALHDQILPIRAAIGGVFDRAPSADVQGAVAVAMVRLHTDRAFARAWMECGT